MRRQYRQGDVLLCGVEEIPLKATPMPSDGNRVIVAFGELTGHAHAFAAKEVRLFRDEPSGRSFLAIAEDGAALVHEEHDPIHVPERSEERRVGKECRCGWWP